MGSVRVKIKKLREDAIVPQYQSEGAAGFDFHAAIDEPIIIQPDEWKEVPFGIALELPIGFELRVRSRSGLAFRDHIIAYHGLVDSDYRGELSVLLHNAGPEAYTVSPGQRVAQGVISKYESVVFIVSDELSETERGANGFGSTGVN